MIKVDTEMAKEIEEDLYVYEDPNRDRQRRKEDVTLAVSFIFKKGTKPIDAVAEILNLRTFASQNNIGSKIIDIEFDMFIKQEEE